MSCRDPKERRGPGLRWAGRAVIGMLALYALVAASGCDSGSSDTNGAGGDFDRPAMLENLADNVIIPAYDDALSAVEGLDAEVAAFAGAPSADGLVAVRSALKNARLAWQHISPYQFGPAEAAALRASVNTYPVDEARIESNIASGSWMLGTIDNRAAAGFPAIAYLVHPPGMSDEDVLASFTTDPQASSRLAYLQENSGFVHDAVASVAEAWVEDGAYRDEFLSVSNAGTDVGSSLGMLVNALVLHVERILRDGKIGIPAGVRSAGIPRPTSTEAFHGGYSVELAVANTRALQRTVFGRSVDGAEGSGLDDYLQALDAADLASGIGAALDEANNALEALDDPLSGQIESDLDPVLTAFTELQDVVVLLKADMTSVLGVTITFQDNDGD